MMKLARLIFPSAAALAALGMVAAPAYAQRDPAYDNARKAGQVGEKMDGYLGIVGASNPTLERMVNDINIRRKAVYTQNAPGARATVEEFAFGAGCKNIRDTVPGEKYQAPNGSWQTRTSSPPDRDPRCP